jgi:hypothetical protein
VLRKVAQISLEATSSFAAGEVYHGDTSVRIDKTNKGIPVKANIYIK